LYFTFKSKNLEEAGYSKTKGLILSYGKAGEMERSIPQPVTDADITYLYGMHLYLCVVPFLKEGSVIRSSTTIDSPWYLDLPKNTGLEQFGLKILEIEDDKERILLQKARHVKGPEMQKLRRIAWEQYVEKNSSMLKKWEIDRARSYLRHTDDFEWPDA